MSKSWIYLVGIAIIILVGLTGVQLFQSITGGTQKANYQVDNINPDFGDEVLEYLQANQ
ncbi:hypothetical protein JW978_01575 [Candidatus Dojkabacteria bacterium]|nr:hypothetical protein [Candidatus Dojkabacteria bacterium]